MKQSGQIALVALLVLTVAATVGLSLIARTTTDLSATRNIEESTRAFSAAEAGIEETLKTGIASPNTSIDSTHGVNYSTNIVAAGASAGTPFIFPQKTASENTETLWLMAHNPDGTLDEAHTYTANTIDVCWSSETITPALVVSILFKASGSYRVAKVAYDPISRGNNFSAPTPGIGSCPTSTSYRSTITFSDILSIPPPGYPLIALRIRPVYSQTRIAVVPAQDLPSQGKSIQSVGTAGSGVSRKIVVDQQYRAPDSIFDYALYSEGSL